MLTHRRPHFVRFISQRPQVCLTSSRPSPVAMPHSSVRYNFKWGNTTKSTSFTTAMDMCAKYKRKMRSVLKKNKELARALGAAKAENAELKADASRWNKIEGLYLPTLRLWLEADRDHIRALFENHVRSTRLLQDLLTPGGDITLTAANSLLNETTSEPRDSQRAPLHPPGSRYSDQDRSMSMVLEEEQEDNTVILEPLSELVEPLETEPEISRSSRVTVRKKSRHSGRHCIPPLDEPLLVSVDQPSAMPSFAVVDEEASSLVAEITGQEKNVVCAETVVVPPPEKLKGHSADEYSAAFSHRPKIPRTPYSAAKDARRVPGPGDACSSPVLTQAQHRRVSEIALPPWPRKRVSAIRPRRNSSMPGSIVQGPLSRRLSGPVGERSPEVTDASLLSPTCVFDVAFVESPSPTQVLERNTLSPQKVALSPAKVADFRVDKNSPPEAKTVRRKSVLKSRPSEGGKKKAASRLTFVLQKGRSQMGGDAAGDLNSGAASPLAQGVGQQREDGCGDGPQDVEGSAQQQRSAALDVAEGPHRGNTALHPKQDHCVDEKPPEVRKSRGKKSQSRKSQGKKTAGSKEPAPQPANPPPPHARRSSCFPLPEPVAAGPTSSMGEGSPPRRSSGRPARSATKCATYNEVSLKVKLRRP